MSYNFGKNVQYRRKELKMSQEELARRMGYSSRSAISKIEVGTNDISQTQLIKFSNALSCDIDFLLDENIEPYLTYDNWQKTRKVELDNWEEETKMKFALEHLSLPENAKEIVSDIMPNLSKEQINDLTRYARFLIANKEGK